MTTDKQPEGADFSVAFAAKSTRPEDVLKALKARVNELEGLQSHADFLIDEFEPLGESAEPVFSLIYFTNPTGPAGHTEICFGYEDADPEMPAVDGWLIVSLDWKKRGPYGSNRWGEPAPWLDDCEALKAPEVGKVLAEIMSDERRKEDKSPDDFISILEAHGFENIQEQIPEG